MSKNTIIKPEDIRKIRPIANNVIDIDRIAPYVYEAETLDLLPAIGAGLYEQLVDGSFADTMQANGSVIITTNGGRKVSLSSGLWDEILNGGFYTCEGCSCGSDEKRYSAGLSTAVSYLAYAGMLPNQPINVTAFGVVNKTTSLSEPVDERIILRAAGEARRKGIEYLGQSVEHLRGVGLIDERINTARLYRKFRVIG
jgi:hypothetical protein